MKLTPCSYVIPGIDGTREVGSRLINWVWYVNYPDGSPEYLELMTDRHGGRHRVTMPVGLIQEQLWTKQKEFALQTLPEPFAELVGFTEMPFIQSITDVIASKISAFGGKMILVGDAVAGFRPHTAASTNQAAYHASLVHRVMTGELEFERAEAMMKRYAEHTSGSGIHMGNGMGLGIFQ